MAISFPSSPSLNQTFTVGYKTWIWNGYAWDIVVANTNAVFTQANAAYTHANSAYQAANNATDTWVRSAANSASSYANSAFVKANSAYAQANTANNTAVHLTGNETITGVKTFSTAPKFAEIRHVNSNVQKFSQVYNGGASGQGNSYFQNNEFQPVFTLTPSASSQNYQVVGRIVVQSGGSSQIVYFQAALRSQTLPTLAWSMSYTEEVIGGTRYIDPVLWVDQTTGLFTFALNGLNVVYGTVTVDLDIIHRYNTTFNDVVMNTVNVSEVTSVPANYTSYAFTKTLNVNGNPYFGAHSIWHAGNDGTGSGLDADLLDGLHSTSFANSTYANTRVDSAFAQANAAFYAANNVVSGFDRIKVGAETLYASTNSSIEIKGAGAISVSASNVNPLSVTISALGGMQGLTVDWGYVYDTTGGATYDFGTL